MRRTILTPRGELIRDLLLATMVVMVLALSAVVLLPSSARATEEPYGGCKEVTQDWPSLIHTPGADDCRALGWTIRPRLVVDNHGVVILNRMPECPWEDGAGYACFWHGQRHNGTGLSYWLPKGGVDVGIHYVWTYQGLGNLDGWGWVADYGQQYIPIRTSQRCAFTVYMTPTHQGTVESHPEAQVYCPDGRSAKVDLSPYVVDPVPLGGAT